MIVLEDCWSLKSWLHRHTDHPYPSEEEKQLCHADAKGQLPSIFTTLEDSASPPQQSPGQWAFRYWRRINEKCSFCQQGM
jgi:hypothetical protein